MMQLEMAWKNGVTIKKNKQTNKKTQRTKVQSWKQAMGMRQKTKVRSKKKSTGKEKTEEGRKGFLRDMLENS